MNVRDFFNEYQNFHFVTGYFTNNNSNFSILGMSKRGPDFAASSVAKRPATECSYYGIGLVSNQVEF